MISHPVVLDFFNRYAWHMNNCLSGEQDVQAIVESFAPFIVNASPLGIVGGITDGNFLNKVQAGIDFYRHIGIVSMNMVNADITPLDDYHTMAKVRWQSFFSTAESSGEIPFEVIYFLQVIDTQPKIFAYITSDEQAALRAYGLIPERESANLSAELEHP